jgi:hypothetical protein
MRSIVDQRGGTGVRIGGIPCAIRRIESCQRVVDAGWSLIATSSSVSNVIIAATAAAASSAEGEPVVVNCIGLPLL